MSPRFPAGSAGAGAPVGGHNYVIYSGMDDAKADAATAFVNFMASAESQAFAAEELGVLPGNADAYDQLGDNERVAAWKPALDVSAGRARGSPRVACSSPRSTRWPPRC